ncbi:MAG: hypothetical protein LBL23_08750 [Coriobacteriales bacterium]|jgi:hypothetical protein|nr:hypothetical protein [Coriobacteriales bacterium]
MGIVIESRKANREYGNHAAQADDFATDAAGHLLPHEGESFETMPLGSVELTAYLAVGKAYRQNPYTFEGMRWEIGFSPSRVCFYSPDTNTILGGVAERADIATMGFYYYTELRSLSLGNVSEPGGAYVSLLFHIWATAKVSMQIGVRVYGEPAQLHVFATLFIARLVEGYAALGPGLGFDSGEAERLFTIVNGFNYESGAQTDLFLVAEENRLRLLVNLP